MQRGEIDRRDCTFSMHGGDMRAFLATTFVLLSVGAAAPESKLASSIGEYLKADAGEGPPARIEIESANHRADPLNATVLPVAASPGEMPHTDAIELPITADTAADRTLSVDDLCKALFTSAQENDLPVQFLANLIWQESRLQNDTVSSAGALGIAQFMPEVAVENGLEDPFDPRQAIPASARLLRGLREQFGNLGFAAAAYNAGPHRVSDWLARGKSLPQETLNYVLRVTGLSANQWRTTPPADTMLTFAQHLPCRAMPAFADLEQTQLVQAQAEPTQPLPKPVEDEKPIAATAPPAKTDGESERRGGVSKVSVAKAWAKALHIAGSDDNGIKRRAKHEREAQHERPKGERNKKLAESRVG
jgi:Transglycosylase SLT domain